MVMGIMSSNLNFATLNLRNWEKKLVHEKILSFLGKKEIKSNI